MEECAREEYENSWKKALPEEIPNAFQYEPEDTPMETFDTPENAFSAIISPGIINQ